VIEYFSFPNLNKDSSTKIYEHGDQWVNRVRRLREIKSLPQQFLAVKNPEAARSNPAEAAREIEAALVRLEMNVVPFFEEERLMEFAKVA
jgi:hypothetical protein